jgi:hypothetical protein
MDGAICFGPGASRPGYGERSLDTLHGPIAGDIARGRASGNVEYWRARAVGDWSAAFGSWNRLGESLSGALWWANVVVLGVFCSTRLLSSMLVMLYGCGWHEGVW